MSLTQGIETRELSSKSRSEYSLILTPNLFIAIIAPLNVYEAECKQFGVRIAGDDLLCSCYVYAHLPQRNSAVCAAGTD